MRISVPHNSKQLELSAEKLNQLQTENAALRDQNKAPNTASNKKRRFNTRVRPMGSLSTPNTGEGTTNATPASGAAGATREGIEDHQIHDLEESDSEPEPEKEEPREDGSRVFHNRLSGANVFQEVRGHAIHGGTSTRSSSPNPVEQPRLVHKYSLRGGDRLSRNDSEILLPQHQDVRWHWRPRRSYRTI